MAKTQAPWREYGFPEIPSEFMLSEAQIAQLAALLGINDPEQCERLRRQLVEIGDTYREGIEEGRVTPSPGERNAALNAILESATELETQLFQLDQVSVGFIMDALEAGSQGQGDSSAQTNGYLQYEEIRSHLETLTRILAPSLEEAKKHRGRPENAILKSTIASLIAVIEEHSRKPFTHTGHIDGEHAREPQSEGGRFIRSVFALLDADVASNSLSSVMAAHIRNKNR